MRLLATIPHYYRATPGEGFYGSELDGRAVRVAAVTRCLAALHQAFGRQALLSGVTPVAANGAMGFDLDVVVVTSGGDHLVRELPRALFRHLPLGVPGRELGFACHKLMQYGAAAYDWFAYLEDDIEVSDALLFDKLAWFNKQFSAAQPGGGVLLQPNRFELADDLNVMKLYIDGGMMEPGEALRFQDIAVRPRLAAEAFGRLVAFQRVPNVHAGCFFLDGPQMRRLAADPAFGVPTDAFIGPLESAATLPVMRCFDVYKPARENAAFLEVRHLGRRFLVPQASGPQALGPQALGPQALGLRA